MRQTGHWVASVAAALLLGPAFWLAAVRGSDLPPILQMTIDVHGLPAPGYAGASGGPLAPLSARIIADARRDAGFSSPAPSAPTAPPSSVTATPLPTARPSTPPGSPLPLPTPTAPPLPTPTGLPLPTPTALPLPTPTALPLPTPTAPLLPTL